MKFTVDMNELKGLRTIMERRKDDYGKKEGGDELYGVGCNVGVKLRKWEKYMPVGGMIQLKRFKLRNVIIIMLTRCRATCM